MNRYFKIAPLFGIIISCNIETESLFIDVD